MRIVKQTREGYKVQFKKKLFWIGKNGELKLITYETKYKRGFELLGHFTSGQAIQSFLEEYCNEA